MGASLQKGGDIARGMWYLIAWAGSKGAKEGGGRESKVRQVGAKTMKEAAEKRRSP